MTIQICFNCDGVMQPNINHNCIRGITENINQLHSNLNTLMVKRSDHLDGLKYALQIIDQLELSYKHMGIEYSDQDKDPFHDLRNQLRMVLGLKLISR